MNGNIYIPKPCHENWNKMTPEEKGRHCAVCSKVVKDFTSMKKEEIMSTILDSDQEVCGRINVNHLTAVSKRQQFYFWIKGTFIPKLGYAAFVLLGFGSLYKKALHAQALPGGMKVEQVFTGQTTVDQTETSSKKIMVEVLNEANKAVREALVNIYSGSELISTQTTDKAGTVSLSMPMQKVGYTTINIEVNAKGYEMKVVKDIRITKNNQAIRVKLDENVILMGKMAYYEAPDPIVDTVQTHEPESPVIVCNEKYSLIRTVEKPELALQEIDFSTQSSIETPSWPSMLDKNPPTLSFVSFPNPTLGDVTIETKMEEAFDIKIYNENGVLIMQTSNQYKRSLIQLQDQAAGTYFAIIFSNNKAIETHKIILVK